MKRIDTVRPPSIVRQDLPRGELESLEIVWSLDEQTSYFVRYLHICFESWFVLRKREMIDFS